MKIDHAWTGLVLVTLLFAAGCAEGDDALGPIPDAAGPGAGEPPEAAPGADASMTIDASQPPDAAAGSTAAEICAALCPRIQECVEPRPSCPDSCVAGLGDCSSDDLPALAACAAEPCADLLDCLERIDCAIEDCGDGLCSPLECDSCAADCPGSPGLCAHDECLAGDPLGPGCSECAADVCSVDPSCCFVAWNERCLDLVEGRCGIDCPTVCGNGFCEDSEDPDTCPHDCHAFCGDGQCTSGGEDCGSCPDDCGECACGDGMCNVGECASCESDCPGGCVCVHDLCTLGSPLDPGCGDCEAQICALDPLCCTASWDGLCRSEAESICGACPHVCDPGPQLRGDSTPKGAASEHD